MREPILIILFEIGRRTTDFDRKMHPRKELECIFQFYGAFPKSRVHFERQGAFRRGSANTNILFSSVFCILHSARVLLLRNMDRLLL